MNYAIQAAYCSLLLTNALAGKIFSSRGKCKVPEPLELQCYHKDELINAEDCNDRCQEILWDVEDDEKLGLCHKGFCSCLWREWNEVAGMSVNWCLKLEKVEKYEKEKIEKMNKKLAKRAQKLGYYRLSRWSLESGDHGPSCSRWKNNDHDASE